MPPRWLSSCVYTIEPTGRSMSLAHIRPRNAVAPGPLDLELGERRSRRTAPAACRVASASAPIAGDQCIARPAARPERLVAGGGVRARTSSGAPSPTSRRTTAPSAASMLVRRRDPQRAAGLALLVRVVDVVVGRVVLVDPRERVAPASGTPAEAADVHLPQVELGLAVDDPARHLPADPARAGDAVRARTRQRRRSRGPRDSPRMNSLSGVNASGPLMIRLTPASSHRRDAADGAGHDRVEARHVGREEPAVEVGRDAVEAPRRGSRS